MSASLNIVETEVRAGSGIPPEHLAIQAPPAIVAFAERIHLVFLETLQSKLETILGATARAAFVQSEQSFLSRYLTGAGPVVHNIVLSLEPMGGCVVVGFSSELLFNVLDILLASPAAATGARGESMTEIELHVLRGFFQIFSDVLNESWGSTPPVALTSVSERGEEVLKAHGESHILAMKSTLELDGTGGDFYVVIPGLLARLSARYSGLKPDETGPADLRSAGSSSTRNQIVAALGSAKVELDAVLSNMTIRIGDLLELAPGQILLAEKTADANFECLVNKRTQFRGELVATGDRYGFQPARNALDDRPE
jgi:flagellar motor switch protein FliM